MKKHKTLTTTDIRSTKHPRRSILSRTIIAAGLLCTAASSYAIISPLVNTPVPVPLDIGNYIDNQFAAEQLGKALFWDMQVGSDGVQACATCHFHAGVDNRTTNQLNPGIDGVFGSNGLGLPEPAPGSMFADQTVTPAHFPLHRITDQQVVAEPLLNPANVVRDTNDVMGSMGLIKTQFTDIVIGQAVENGSVIPDPIFNVNGTNIRQVTNRNTPSTINAVFNFDNFHDGRANNIFNGANAFGPADPREHLINNDVGTLATEELRIRQSSLASQAVTPPMSTVEMSFVGRTFPKLGKKMLSLRPLEQQQVSPNDSRLGFLSDGAPGGTGLNTTYQALIENAFADRYWNNTTEKVTFDLNGIPSFSAGPADPSDTNEFTQMEANFATFWGLAIQSYLSTLVSGESRFDAVTLNGGLMTNEEEIGLAVFNGDGGCINCHDGDTSMDINAALIQGVDPVSEIPVPFDQNPLAANEFMQISTGLAFYDNGYHNTGVRPQGNPNPTAPDFLATNEDVGRGGTTSLGPGFVEIALSKSILSIQDIGMEPLQMPTLDPLPAHMAGWVPVLTTLGFNPGDTTPFAGRVTNFGAFKTPSIRNLSLTGPYMHNGGLSTIRQIVDFYVRGGDFPITNNMNFDSEGMKVLPLLRDSGAIPNLPTPEELRDGLAQFLMALTDPRVANEEAPFDHPELFVPITGTAPVSPGRGGMLADTTNFRRVAAVGGDGRSATGIPPLGTFLGLNPRSEGLLSDPDLDLIEDSLDNCPIHANPGQEDGDADGVGDACDNCTLVANGPLLPDAGGNSQLDTDGDGFGNICDADLNNDNDVTLGDFSLFRSAFGAIGPNDADLNGDGDVSLGDFSIFRSSFGSAPGPSGLNP